MADKTHIVQSTLQTKDLVALAKYTNGFKMAKYLSIDKATKVKIERKARKMYKTGE